MDIFYIDQEAKCAEVHIDAPTAEGFCFDGMYLHASAFRGLVFNGASFILCYLRCAYMEDAKAANVDFTSASMAQVYFHRARLCGSSFRNARLHWAVFEDADLSGADLRDAETENTNFERCNLCGAVMLCRGLESALFAGAVFDKHTIWPEGFDPLEHGAMLIKDERPADI